MNVIAKDFDSLKVLTILDGRTQAITRNHFLRYSRAVRNRVKVITMDRFSPYDKLTKHPRFPIFKLGLKQSLPRLFHFQEKQANQFFGLIEETLNSVKPIFQTVCRTFLKDKEQIVNALELSYSNAKLEATNNLIKVIKRNAFGFRKMKRQNSHFHCFKHQKREDKACPLSVLDWSTHYS